MRAHGGIAYRVHASSDDPQAFTEALSDQLVRADLVVTSGGVSKGTHDVVKEVLSGLGTVDFLEVAMQPGKPQGFGVVGEDAHPDLHAARATRSRRTSPSRCSWSRRCAS